jgi:hypothetical protein
MSDSYAVTKFMRDKTLSFNSDTASILPFHSSFKLLIKSKCAVRFSMLVVRSFFEERTRLDEVPLGGLVGFVFVCMLRACPHLLANPLHDVIVFIFKSAAVLEKLFQFLFCT